ncbi:hypothetical protein LCGC14_1771490, partial [marine sediment metagenome]
TGLGAGGGGVNLLPTPPQFLARERTIIIRAATELYPAIEDLLATIDKEPTAPMDYKIFTLENVMAEEVETQLKAMFKLDRRGGARRARRRPHRGSPACRPLGCARSPPRRRERGG